jgi:hypothetical protein
MTPLVALLEIPAALDAIVSVLVDAGLPATRDPGDFQPPGGIVAPPTIVGASTMQSIALTVPVWIVTDQPGQEGTDWALGWVAVLLPVLGESAAEPLPWISPINPAGLPAYLITVHANVATT